MTRPTPHHVARHHSMVLSDYFFTVPLDHAHPHGPTIQVFARTVVSRKHQTSERPWLLFLQGGPGFPGPRPLTNGGWLNKALEEYHVILLDSRGNGRSTVVLTQTLTALGTPAQQADYLRHFRADSIVRDAEIIRRQLVGETVKWSVLGQSFGGFCAVQYVSAYPEALNEVYITGGLPPLTAHPDDYYRLTYPEVERKTRKFFARYPHQRQQCKRILAHLHEHDVALPTGGRLTPRRFQQLGFLFGTDEGLDQVHYLLEDAFCDDSAHSALKYSFLRAVENLQPFETNPIFAILHEMCYTQGFASRWSAERVRAEFPLANWAPGKEPGFTGEMIYPWMFTEYPQLRPLREAAEILAQDESWPHLYDPVRLAANEVPVAAVIYAEDMYVPRAFSEQTAASIGNVQAWLTNEHEHNGLRSSENVFARLMTIMRDMH